MRSRAGFTLIEVLVALMVFLAGVTGILALMTTALAMHRDGLVQARATRRLDDLVERARRLAAEGLLVDARTGEPSGLRAEKLEDGLWWDLRRLPARGEEGPLAELRVAGSEAGLAAAEPVLCVLPEGPRPEVLAERLARRLRGGTPP